METSMARLVNMSVKTDPYLEDQQLLCARKMMTSHMDFGAGEILNLTVKVGINFWKTYLKTINQDIEHQFYSSIFWSYQLKSEFILDQHNKVVRKIVL